MTKRKPHHNPAPSGCRELFDYTRQFVDVDLLMNNVPNDPGYPAYRRRWRAILGAGIPPNSEAWKAYEISETSTWMNADGVSEDTRYLRTRTFVNATGLAINAATGDHDLIPTNYAAIGLIRDAESLADRDLIRRLVSAFDEIDTKLLGSYETQAPLLLLGSLIARYMLGEPPEDVKAFVEHLMEQEQYYNSKYREFLWSCDAFRGYHAQWKTAVRRYLPENDPLLAPLRSRLLSAEL
ncbi:MAG: hypothetical protein LBE83_09815 [Propionibacteriaceae bacterium]|jgi:hypothetical protein|nr:hypothetical protein [Propionibacteriaceae bacterium]